MEIGKTLEIATASSMGDKGRDAEEDQKEEAVAQLSKSTGDLPSSTATDLQKKLRRAERFGVPVLLSEKEKRNSRAERFGTAPSSLGSSSEEQKRKIRAERFGTAKAQISTCDEEAKKKARLARFAGDNSKPILNSVEEDQKRQARAIRFSQTRSNGKEVKSKQEEANKAT